MPYFKRFWLTSELFGQKSLFLALHMERYLDPIQFSHSAKSRKWLAKHSCFFLNPWQVGGTELQRCSPRKATGAIVVMWKCRPVLLIHANLSSSSHCLQFYFQFFASFFFLLCFSFFCVFYKRLVPAELNWLGTERQIEITVPQRGKQNESGFGGNFKDAEISASLCLSLSICFVSWDWIDKQTYLPLCLIKLWFAPEFLILAF